MSAKLRDLSRFAKKILPSASVNFSLTSRNSSGNTSSTNLFMCESLTISIEDISRNQFGNRCDGYRCRMRSLWIGGLGRDIMGNVREVGFCTCGIHRIHVSYGSGVHTCTHTVWRLSKKKNRKVHISEKCTFHRFTCMSL